MSAGEIRNEADESLPRSAGNCETAKRLLDEFAEAVRGVIILHEQQFLAIVEGDAEANRFDLLIHAALERKQNAKYAYLNHLDVHGCSL